MFEKKDIYRFGKFFMIGFPEYYQNKKVTKFLVDSAIRIFMSQHNWSRMQKELGWNILRDSAVNTIINDKRIETKEIVLEQLHQEEELKSASCLLKVISLQKFVYWAKRATIRTSEKRSKLQKSDTKNLKWLFRKFEMPKCY